MVVQLSRIWRNRPALHSRVLRPNLLPRCLQLRNLFVSEDFFLPLTISLAPPPLTHWQSRGDLTHQKWSQLKAQQAHRALLLLYLWKIHQWDNCCQIHLYRQAVGRRSYQSPCWYQIQEICQRTRFCLRNVRWVGILLFICLAYVLLHTFFVFDIIFFSSRLISLHW